MRLLRSAPYAHRDTANLLSLALFHGHRTKLNFDIATNVDYGFKFDDLTITYHTQMEKTKEIAKHFIFSQTVFLPMASEKIITSDVLNGEEIISKFPNDFNLSGYFRSYLRIKNQFRDSENILENLIFYTNVLNHDANLFEKCSIDDNSYLKLISTGTDYRKLKTEVVKDLLQKGGKKILIKNDSKLLAECLHKQLFKDGTDEKQPKLRPLLDSPESNLAIEYYHKALIEEKVLIEVNDKKTKKISFHDNFKNGDKCLSDAAKKLRKKMLKLENNDEKRLMNKLEKSSWTKTKIFDHETNIQKLPNYKITDEDISDFCNILIFFLGQSYGKHLPSALDNELQKSNYVPHYFELIKYKCRRLIAKNSLGFKNQIFIKNEKYQEFYKKLKPYELSEMKSIYRNLLVQCILLEQIIGDETDFEVNFNHNLFDIVVQSKKQGKPFNTYFKTLHSKGDSGEPNTNDLVSYCKQLTGVIKDQVPGKVIIYTDLDSKTLNDETQKSKDNPRKKYIKDYYETLKKEVKNIELKYEQDCMQLSEKIDQLLQDKNISYDLIKYELKKLTKGDKDDNKWVTKEKLKSRFDALYVIKACNELLQHSDDFVIKLRTILSKYEPHFKNTSNLIKPIAEFEKLQTKQNDQGRVIIKTNSILLTTLKFYKQWHKKGQQFLYVSGEYLRIEENKNKVKKALESMPEYILVIVNYSDIKISCEKAILITTPDISIKNVKSIDDSKSDSDLEEEFSTFLKKPICVLGKTVTLQNLQVDCKFFKYHQTDIIDFMYSERIRFNMNIPSNTQPENSVKENYIERKFLQKDNTVVVSEEDVYNADQKACIISSDSNVVGKTWFLNRIAERKKKDYNYIIKLSLKEIPSKEIKETSAIENLADSILKVKNIERLILIKILEDKTSNMLLVIDDFRNSDIRFFEQLYKIPAISRIVIATREMGFDCRNATTFVLQPPVLDMDGVITSMFAHKEQNNLLKAYEYALCKFNLEHLLEDDRKDIPETEENDQDTNSSSGEEKDELNKKLDQRLPIADFLLAYFLNNNYFKDELVTTKQYEFIVDDVLCNKRFKTVRFYLNEMIDNDIESLGEKYGKVLDSVVTRKTFSVNNGRTTLCIAVQENNLNIVSLLLLCMSKMNNKNVLLDVTINGFTPIQLAAKSKNSEIIKKFQSNNINMDSKSIYLASDDRKFLNDHLVKESINEKDVNGKTALHYAAEDAESETKIKNLIDIGADVNCRNNSGATPLDVAIQCRNNKILNLLDGNASGINEYDGGKERTMKISKWKLVSSIVKTISKANPQNTVLHYACLGGNLDMIKELAQENKQEIIERLEVPNGEGMTSIHCAMSNGHDEIVKYYLQDLYENKMDDNDKIKLLKEFVLLESKKKQNVNLINKAVKVVLDNLQIQEENCKELIELLAKVNQKGIVKTLLLKLNSDKKEQVRYVFENQCKSVLKLFTHDWAELIGKNKFECQNKMLDMEMLQKIVYSIDSEIPGVIMEFLIRRDREFLEKLLQESQNGDMMNVFRLKTINLREVDTWGNTILHLAILSLYKPLIDVLLENESIDSIINVRNKYENTPLAIAMLQYPKKSDKENDELKKIINNLIARKPVDLKVLTAQKNTILHLAVFTGDYDIVEELINRQKDRIGNINEGNSDGNTPLNLAVQLKNKEMVQLLLEHNGL